MFSDLISRFFRGCLRISGLPYSKDISPSSSPSALAGDLGGPLSRSQPTSDGGDLSSALSTGPSSGSMPRAVLAPGLNPPSTTLPLSDQASDLTEISSVGVERALLPSAEETQRRCKQIDFARSTGRTVIPSSSHFSFESVGRPCSITSKDP